MWRWRAASALVLMLATFWMARPGPAPRDIILDRPLPGGPLQIVVFGTSLTAPPQTWPDRLAQELSTCRDAAVSVMRVAGPGQGSEWALDRIGLAAESAPDLVLIEFAVNDADLRDGLWFSDSRANHRRLLAELRIALPQARLMMMSMNPVQGLRGWIRPFLPRYYSIARIEAAAAGAGFADLYPRWLALPRSRRGLAADGLHPDSEVAASVIVPALMTLIAPDCPPE